MQPGTVCAPLRSEWAALRGAIAAPMVRTGRGPTHRLDGQAGAIAVAGVAGALAPGLLPGDLVVAQEIRRRGSMLPSYAAPLLYSALRHLGLRVHLGPIYSAEYIVDGPARERLAATGALAVDTESAFLAGAVPDGRAVVLRAIVDTPNAPLVHPGTVLRGIRALHALRCAAPILDRWAAALGEREVLLFGPSQAGSGARAHPDAAEEDSDGARPHADRTLPPTSTPKAHEFGPHARRIRPPRTDLVLVLVAPEAAGAQPSATPRADTRVPRITGKYIWGPAHSGTAEISEMCPDAGLVELAATQGVPVHPIGRVDDLDLHLLRNTRRIAVFAAPSAPATLRTELIDALSGLGPVRVRETTVAEELRSTLGR
ncbi:hypothetical protein [Nocardia wallacei]|uniref:phosphorylase family protein n=1 Tax=Nocardia wallacei TaxID=480035 RepID=UPI002458761F|nr:hypothetical protein [Nocardia wallacei]